jgi:hypothetical protein
VVLRNGRVLRLPDGVAPARWLDEDDDAQSKVWSRQRLHEGTEQQSGEVGY